MAALAPTFDRTGARPFVVPLPRRTDAIGDVLKRSFHPPRLSTDALAGMLRELDAID